jgi:uncharacterized protein (TIGR02646 family)
VIHVDRNRIDDLGKTIEPNQPWRDESIRQRTRAESDGPHHVVTDHYKTAHLRAVLVELFNNKCAYCETPNLNQSDWNVDHFRPKGRVSEDDEHPGYYWLAYEWTNLYPACVFCNQRRIDRPTYADQTSGPSKGKLDQFPLEPGSLRASSHHDADVEERPAILDPCVDEPERHLSFKVEGTVHALDASPKGDPSIEVFALDRQTLTKCRKDFLTKLATNVEQNISNGDTRERALVNALAARDHPTDGYRGVIASIRRDPVAFGF